MAPCDIISQDDGCDVILEYNMQLLHCTLNAIDPLL